MLTNARQLHNLKDLRKYVNETLCESDQLVADTFPVTERIVTRGGRPCGIFFCLHGPRSIKLTAIWETDTNTILFYGSGGERYHKTELESAPTLEPTTAESSTEEVAPATAS